jgi:selenide,water dikinase
VLDDDGYRAMIDTTTRLNIPGMELSKLRGVHAMTDVTGFGLLGHLLEMCRGSSLGARIEAERLPLLPGVLELAHAGIATGASTRNWEACGDEVRLASHIESATRAILTDPQTSGGLLVACAPDEASRVLDLFKELRFERATVIGRFAGGDVRIDVD